MKNKFEKVGVIYMAPSKRSLRIELKNYPFTCPYYVSIKDIENVLANRKKTATIVKPTK